MRKKETTESSTKSSESSSSKSSSGMNGITGKAITENKGSKGIGQEVKVFIHEVKTVIVNIGHSIKEFVKNLLGLNKDSKIKNVK